MKTRDLLNRVCGMRVRYYRTQDGIWHVIAASDGIADDVSRSILDTGLVRYGKEQWERLRQFGPAWQHVYTLHIGRSVIRIVAPMVDLLRNKPI